MKLREIHRILGKLQASPSNITDREASVIVDHIISLEELPDECDEDDTFGTEGWKHQLGAEN